MTSQLCSTKSNTDIKILVSCETGSWRKICKGSYTSGDFKKIEALIIAKGGTSFIVDYAGKSTRVSINNSATSMGCEEISSCNDINSATTTGPGLLSSFGSASGFLTIYTAFLSTIFIILVRIFLHSAIRPLNCGLLRCGAHRVRRISCKISQSRQSI